jgi:hypothetical protein
MQGLFCEIFNKVLCPAVAERRMTNNEYRITDEKDLRCIILYDAQFCRAMPSRSCPQDPGEDFSLAIEFQKPGFSPSNKFEGATQCK